MKKKWNMRSGKENKHLKNEDPRGPSKVCTCRDLPGTIKVHGHIIFDPNELVLSESYRNPL